MFRKSEYTIKVEYISYTPQKNFTENPGNNNPQEKVILDFL